MESCSVELFHSFLNLPCWVKHILVWVNQHQILISAFIAAVAAWRTIKNIRAQISQNELHFERNISFRHSTARAKNIVAASRLNTYSDKVILSIVGDLICWRSSVESEIKSQATSFAASQKAFQLDCPQQIPENLIEDLSELMEGLVDEDKAVLADCIGQIQLANSSLLSLKSSLNEDNSIVMEANFFSVIYRFVVVLNHANRLLEYCRNPTLERLPDFDNTPDIGPIFSSPLFYDPAFIRRRNAWKWPPTSIKEKQIAFRNSKETD